MTTTRVTTRVISAAALGLAAIATVIIVLGGVGGGDAHRFERNVYAL